MKLPKNIKIKIIETKNGCTQIFIPLVQGHFIQIGAKTEDWSNKSDGFKFHDVFHFANFAILKWSPVTRSLLNLDRKKYPNKFIFEDGYRAQIIEEAITAFVIDDADCLRFRSKKDIPDTLINIIKTLTSKFEIKNANEENWRESIFQGYVAWKKLKEFKSGLIEMDLKNRLLVFHEDFN